MNENRAMQDDEMLVGLWGLKYSIERSQRQLGGVNIIEYRRHELQVLSNLPRILDLVIKGLAAEKEPK